MSERGQRQRRATGCIAHKQSKTLKERETQPRANAEQTRFRGDERLQVHDVVAPEEVGRQVRQRRLLARHLRRFTWMSAARPLLCGVLEPGSGR